MTKKVNTAVHHAFVEHTLLTKVVAYIIVKFPNMKGPKTHITYLRSHCFLFTILFLFFFSMSTQSDSVSASECVILLHGLARTSSSMNKLEKRLNKENYSVINVDYPSRQKKIEELAEIAVNEGLEFCRKEKALRIHFVTHSLGGILVRYYLASQKIPEMGRIVMLAPPNQGSRVVDKFSGYPGYGVINGPAGYQLGTDENSIPLQLGPADFELGIIAGNKTINLILSTAFDESNDGKVAVKDTQLEGMTDFLVVPYAHPFIMDSNEVIDQVLYFLRHGFFIKNKEVFSGPE